MINRFDKGLLRVPRFLVNWIVIISAPIWIYFVLIYTFLEASDSVDVLSGKRYFWGDEL